MSVWRRNVLEGVTNEAEPSYPQTEALIGSADPMSLPEALRVVARAGYFTVEDCDAHCESCGAPMPWNVIRGPFVNRKDAP